METVELCSFHLGGSEQYVLSLGRASAPWNFVATPFSWEAVLMFQHKATALPPCWDLLAKCREKQRVMSAGSEDRRSSSQTFSFWLCLLYFFLGLWEAVGNGTVTSFFSAGVLSIWLAGWIQLAQLLLSSLSSYRWTTPSCGAWWGAWTPTKSKTLGPRW